MFNFPAPRVLLRLMPLGLPTLAVLVLADLLLSPFDNASHAQALLYCGPFKFFASL
jgi:hypothetical protein